MILKKEKRSFYSGGATLIEYAILLPVLLMFIFGIIDVGRIIWTQATLNRAVEAAARCGAVNDTDCNTMTQVQNYAVAQSPGLNISVSAFTATLKSCGVQVVASFPFVFSTPLVQASGITLSATACYPD